MTDQPCIHPAPHRKALVTSALEYWLTCHRHLDFICIICTCRHKPQLLGVHTCSCREVPSEALCAGWYLRCMRSM